MKRVSRLMLFILPVVFFAPVSFAEVNALCCGKWITLHEEGAGFARDWNCMGFLLKTESGAKGSQLKAKICEQIEGSLCHPSYAKACNCFNNPEGNIDSCSNLEEKIAHHQCMLSTYQLLITYLDTGAWIATDRYIVDMNGNTVVEFGVNGLLEYVHELAKERGCVSSGALDDSLGGLTEPNFDNCSCETRVKVGCEDSAVLKQRMQHEYFHCQTMIRVCNAARSGQDSGFSYRDQLEDEEAHYASGITNLQNTLQQRQSEGICE